MTGFKVINTNPAHQYLLRADEQEKRERLFGVLRYGRSRDVPEMLAMKRILEGEYAIELFRDERGELVIIVSARQSSDRILLVACDPQVERGAYTMAFRAVSPPVDYGYVAPKGGG
jgi:hypothetical protein